MYQSVDALTHGPLEDRTAPCRGRLLYVVNAPGFFISHRLALAQAAKSSGYEVGVCTPDGQAVDLIKQAGLHWFKLPIDRGGMNPFRDLSTLHYLLRLYRRWRPDVVHHVTIKPVLYGTLAARLSGVKRVVNAISGMGYLFTSDGWKSLLGTALYRLFLRHQNMAVIVQNQDDLSFFRRSGLVPAHDLVLIPGSGVDLDKFKPAPLSDEDAARPIVVQTSRMLADKGVREFIEAARQLRGRYPVARFVLVGAPDPGNPTAIPEEELNAAAASGAIEWWGERSDVAEILTRASIFCLPSYREGLSRSLIEAAAAGLPLITTDSTGGRDVVRHGENGMLVPPRDAAALAAAIARLLDNPLSRLTLGATARRDAVSRFDLSIVIPSQIKLYRY